MELIEVHVIGPQPSEAPINRFPHMLGASVASSTRRRRSRSLGVIGGAHHQPDFGGEHCALAIVARQCAPDQFLVGVRPVRVGGVDQCHPELERSVDDRYGCRVIARGLQVIGRSHAHASKADDPDLRSAVAERCGLHAAHCRCGCDSSLHRAAAATTVKRQTSSEADVRRPRSRRQPSTGISAKRHLERGLTAMHLRQGGKSTTAPPSPMRMGKPCSWTRR